MSFLGQGAMTALEQFLTDAADGWNASLIAYRAALGLAATTTPPAPLPDIGTIEPWRHNVRAAQRFPYCSLYLEERDEETDFNSRMFPFRVLLTLVLLDNSITGGTAALPQAAWRYMDLLQNMLNRATPDVAPGREGHTLNNGGSASGGRVLHAVLGSVRPGVDEHLERGNYAIQGALTIRMAEDYP